ncbi:hypothetical protein [Sphingobium nicotianae]|uniref:Uncharacterized protein n=1 Tax=Sphingobium nicotianae TaxID=2782607 RepID=A0A9X1IT77_9SPHN|nr:hypothetical protein [Sphingobium nicotianae]MBT2189421.1 hypothetical protein [Sphingobium nicotianae]
MNSFKTVGHIVLIGCVALLAIVIAVAAYKYLVRPARKLTSGSWRSNALSRSVALGAALGIGLGVWLGYSNYELLRGVVRLGVMGTVLGLIVGVFLMILARASKRGARER